MFKDASQFNIERNNELNNLPKEIIDDDGFDNLPDEIYFDEIENDKNETIIESTDFKNSKHSELPKEIIDNVWDEKIPKEVSIEETNNNLQPDKKISVFDNTNITENYVENKYQFSGTQDGNSSNDSGDDSSDKKQADTNNNDITSDKGDDIGTDSEKKEKSELTNDEINELQQQAIKKAFDKIANGDELTDAEKGNLGEMLMDQYYISKGYTPIHSPRVTDLEHKSGQGIDGVYEKTNPDGSKEYVIADAKVNTSKLNKGLADGTDQMSDAWVEKRLDNAVGKEKADDIRDTYEDDPDKVSKTVYHFSYIDNDDGISTADVSSVDAEGNQEKNGITVQVFDKYGNEIDGGAI